MIQRQINRIRTWWRKRTAPAPDIAQYTEAQAYSVNDGVDYSLPVMLPGDMARDLANVVTPSGKTGLQLYLAEAARDNLRFQFDTPQRSGTYDSPVTMPTDDPLEEWNWQTRKSVLTNCHAAYQRNPLAKAAILYSADFIIGETGFTLSAKNKDVETLLNAFIDHEDNQLRTYERMAIQDLQVDGELVIRLFDEDGEVVIAPQKPWELKEIETPDGMLTRAVAFIFQRDGKEDESVPASDVMHVAINRHAYELRGRPELFTILPWLKAYKEWLEDRARQNHWRGSLLWWVKVAATVPGTIARVLSRWKKPPTPGSVVVTSDKEEITPLTNSTNAGDVAEDGRQIKLMSVMGLRMAEYFLGDGENANLATATAQQLPSLMKFSALQQVMEQQLWRPLFRLVLQKAIDAGALPDTVPVQDGDGEAIEGEGTIDTLDAFEVKYPPIVDMDLLKVAQSLAIATTNGWISDETATEELGFDPVKEQKRQKAEMEREQEEIKKGLRMAPPEMRDNSLGVNGTGEDEREPESEVA